MARGAPRFTRVAVVVCDSCGVGGAPDAERFGDAGADTLGHVIAAAAPELPFLIRMGLGRVPGVPLPVEPDPVGAWGRLTARGPGKDTLLGHWELMGVVVPRPLPLYPEGFPAELIAAIEREVGRGTLGNRPASGTRVIEELGPAHVESGDLIVYTSGDSVLQIAAHEEVVPTEELYRVCTAVRELMTDEHAVGRVIARPFAGEGPGSYRRTGRRDFPLPPPAPTALDLLAAAGVHVRAVGKIADIFGGRGIGSVMKTPDNEAGVDATIDALGDPGVDLVLTNLVDFDTDYGHRNDPAGYAAALERLDRRLPEMLAALPENGGLMLTADHGNDPTRPGTDHTRERVPLLVAGPAVGPGDLGTRDFADLGATLLELFGVSGALAGRSFLDDIPGPSRRC